jgi:protein required for attachment to host cells
LSGFNKRFDNRKLNAPNAEEFSNDQNSANTSSSHSNKSTSTKNKEQEKHEIKETTTKESRKRSASPKIAYEKFEPLIGLPRLNDKIAFQVA